jgi:hypothetical protein
MSEQLECEEEEVSSGRPTDGIGGVGTTPDSLVWWSGLMLLLLLLLLPRDAVLRPASVGAACPNGNCFVGKAGDRILAHSNSSLAWLQDRVSASSLSPTGKRWRRGGE